MVLNLSIITGLCTYLCVVCICTTFFSIFSQFQVDTPKILLPRCYLPALFHYPGIRHCFRSVTESSPVTGSTSPTLKLEHTHSTPPQLSLSFCLLDHTPPTRSLSLLPQRWDWDPTVLPRQSGHPNLVSIKDKR